MNLQENYKEHSKNYIFSDNEILSKQRETIFNKINSKVFEKKNNESLKNINFTDLSTFKYYYETSKNNTSVKLTNQNIYQND